MKKIIVLLVFLMLFTGCASSEGAWEKECAVYEEGYKEGYEDAIEAIMDEIPWEMLDKEELEDALYKVFEDGEYAEEIRDQILSYCELYEREDFKIDYSDSGMDYDF